jgi:hypothetical protein
MARFFFITAIVAVAGIIYLFYAKILQRYLKYSGSRVITCPENEEVEGVSLDAMHAAITETLGAPDFRLESCSRWPIYADCDQRCLLQVEVAPSECMIRGVLMHWYNGKVCVFCRKEFHEIHWTDSKPALLDPAGFTVEWSEIPFDKFESVLDTHLPVCWNCHIAETFRRLHPDLVTDRPRRSEARTRVH